MHSRNNSVFRVFLASSFERVGYAIDFIRFMYVEIPLDSRYTSVGLCIFAFLLFLDDFLVVVRFIGVRTCVRANEQYVHKCTRSLSLSLSAPCPFLVSTLQIVTSLPRLTNATTVVRARHAIAATTRCKLNRPYKCGTIIVL